MLLLNSDNFKNTLINLGINKGSIVYVTGNLGNLGNPYTKSGQKIRTKKEILEFYFQSIMDVIGKSGTLIFPCHSFNLVNKEIIFDPLITPTNYTFSEFLRNKLPIERQIHPYASIAAYGKFSKKIISDQITKHPYGINSPYKYLEENNCFFVSLGLKARRTISAVHYCEFKIGVPYRYTKLFRHRVKIKGIETFEEFFLYVCYDNIEIVRDRNKKIFEDNKIKKLLKKFSIGNSFIESIPMNLFIKETLELMIKDPFIWIKSIKKEDKKLPWES